jgi:hypothetical protein
MADVFQTMSPEDRLTFTEDTHDYGYVVRGVEGEIQSLNKLSREIAIDDGRTSSWRVITGEHKLIPFPVGDLTKRFRRDTYQSRGSEFHIKCPVALLYTMFDDDKLPEKPLSNTSSTSGTVRHAIASEECSHYSFTEHGVPRSLYCERDVEYLLDINTLDKQRLNEFFKKRTKELFGRHAKDIPEFRLDPDDIDIGELVLRGRADSLLRIGPYLVVLDFKRGAYGLHEKKSNKLQFGVYALAVEQLIDQEFAGRILISINRKRDSSRGSLTTPKPHFTIMYPESDLEDQINLHLVANYLMRKQLLDDPELYFNLCHLQREQNIVRKGEKTSKCEAISSDNPCFDFESNACDIVQRYVKKGGDLRKLLLQDVVI